MSEPTTKSASPYKMKLIGEFTLQNPRTVTGNDQKLYDIASGRHSLVGAMTKDGKLHEAVIVYKGIEKVSKSEALLPEKLQAQELAQYQSIGLVKIEASQKEMVQAALKKSAQKLESPSLSPSIKR
jgi:hypothetical protein